MRKILLVLALISALMLSSCTNETPQATSSSNAYIYEEEELSEITATAKDALEDLAPLGEITISGEDGKVSIFAIIREENGAKLSSFGNYIFDIVEAAQSAGALHNDNEVIVSYWGRKGGSDLTFTSNLDGLGTIADSRSGETIYTEYNNFAELAEDFPALQLYPPYEAIVENN